MFNAVVPAYVDDEQNNEIEGSTTEYELKSPDGKEINPDQNLSGEDAKSAYYMVTVEVDSDEHGIAIGQGIRQTICCYYVSFVRYICDIYGIENRRLFHAVHFSDYYFNYYCLFRICFVWSKRF